MTRFALALCSTLTLRIVDGVCTDVIQWANASGFVPYWRNTPGVFIDMETNYRIMFPNVTAVSVVDLNNGSIHVLVAWAPELIIDPTLDTYTTDFQYYFVTIGPLDIVNATGVQIINNETFYGNDIPPWVCSAGTDCMDCGPSNRLVLSPDDRCDNRLSSMLNVTLHFTLNQTIMALTTSCEDAACPKHTCADGRCVLDASECNVLYSCPGTFLFSHCLQSLTLLQVTVVFAPMTMRTFVYVAKDGMDVYAPSPTLCIADARSGMWNGILRCKINRHLRSMYVWWPTVT
jgi:hypothetical protein